MRIYSKELKRALRWLAAGRSIRVIRFLEPKVPIYLENPDYYAILGRAFLDNGMVKDAEIYLNRGLQADPNHLDIRLTLAVNYLKRKDPASAVRIWLDVLEDKNDEIHAKRGLKVLKKISDQESQDRFLNHFNPANFLPNISSKWPGRILIILIALLAGLISLYFRYEIGTIIGNASEPKIIRAGSESIRKIKSDLVDEELDAAYPMNEAEAARTLKRAQRHFNAYNDNSARFELNKILNSNATAEVRKQALLVLNLLDESDFETLESDFSYADVHANPKLYEGCWILWKGRTANVSFNDDSIAFDFLVGFHKNEILEGRVPVEVPFLAVMEPLPLELLARISLDGDAITLIAKTLHFIRQ